MPRRMGCYEFERHSEARKYLSGHLTYASWPHVNQRAGFAEDLPVRNRGT
jgi:hypothetical protein